MKRSEKKKLQVQTMLVQGMDVLDIAKELNMSRSKVYDIRNEMEDDAINNSVNDLCKATPAILNEVASKVRARAPLVLEDEVTRVLDAAESLQRLEVSFHKTFANILTRANEILDREDLTIPQWQTVTNTLSNAFKEIYNSKGTTINVAQADSISGATKNSVTMFQPRM